MALLLEVKDLVAQIKAGGYEDDHDTVMLNAEDHIEATTVNVKKEELDRLDTKRVDQLADSIIKKEEEQDEDS